VQQISIFLTLDAGKRDFAKSSRGCRQAKAGSWRFVPRDEALKRLQASEGNGRDHCQPAAQPSARRLCRHPGRRAAGATRALAKTFSGWPKVAHVQLDSAWVKRFDALLRLGKLVVVLLGVLFAGALVTITFNTIRLQILAQAAEIEVAKLIGATDTYIQRPLHYFGMLQGALGGLCAALLVAPAATC
jgi:cell division transport system permease protein